MAEVTPSPIDGLVHDLKAASTERGTRMIVVRCGAPMPKFRSFDTLAGATAWYSKVTCPSCLALSNHLPKETHDVEA